MFVKPSTLSYRFFFTLYSMEPGPSLDNPYIMMEHGMNE